MQYMGLNEIREKYLAFFESKGHLRLPSFPLIPQGDASLLLINAGMAPLKPYFTGKEVPPRKRVTTCQKCIRTPDIERVGKTARHGTFFEMLGNFSFGDYFKTEVTAWAWEFCTKVMELPVDRLYVSVYEEDDEAYDIWTKQIGVAPDHMVRFGKEDNFWEIGTGPCGPCSELYFDRGEKFGCGSPDCKVGCDCDRFVEFWNLVFTQFDKDEEGNYNRLANPNIDTGMGLERIAAIMQGVSNLFEVDTVRNIMLKISEAAGVNYGDSEKTDVSLRIITDHIRSTVMMVCDGVLPSNEGRGYVLRRLLRRAARHGKLLGISEAFLYKIAETVVHESKDAYPELEEKQAYIQKIIKLEEARFDATIDQGLNILEKFIADLKAAGKTELSGADAFKLYDTYGFPLDLTLEILSEQQLTVDEAAFQEAMNEQRTRAREARREGEEAGWSNNVFDELDDSITTAFVGYDATAGEGTVTAIIMGDEQVGSISKGADAVVILDKTVFYGEKGGQVGDTGLMTAKNARMTVIDTKCQGTRILHVVKVEEGTLALGETVSLAVDTDRRDAIARNHTATHLLHRALKDVLGDHIAQAGSLVSPDRLRFDFSHFEGVTAEQLAEVETRANAQILRDLTVTTEELPIEEAKKKGATALFGEKYGDTVRVVTAGDYSMELCGGCHVNHTARIGLVKILSESSVAAGVRRIEAVTGAGVLAFIREREALIAETMSAAKANHAGELVQKVQTLSADLKAAQKTADELRGKLAVGQIQGILDSKKIVGETTVYTATLQGLTVDDLRNIGDRLKDTAENVLVVLANVTGDASMNWLATATKAAVASGIHCGNIVKALATVTGGGGGGKPDSAQAGGKNPAKAAEAFAKLEELLG